MADGRKATITAKVASQCSDFYYRSLTNLEKSAASSEFGSSQVKVRGQSQDRGVQKGRAVTDALVVNIFKVFSFFILLLHAGFRAHAGPNSMQCWS